MQNDIQNLVQQALQGDERAYEGLMNRYRTGIFNLIFQMIKNREETEDLVQETFIKAFHSLTSYDNHYAFSTWLYKIAYNSCIDSIRKKKLKTTSLDKPSSYGDQSLIHQIGTESDSPEISLIFAEKKRIVSETIQALPDSYRETFLLRHQDERSYEEISEKLGIPIGTVKARLFRAREILKQQLTEH